MNKIPVKLRAKLAADIFYTRCCVTGLPSTFEDPIEWHHNLIFAGRQVQARFAILPIKRSVHRIAMLPEIKDKLDWVMVSRMSGEDLELYGKGVDWLHRKEYLEVLFGTFVPWHEERIHYER